MRVLDLFSGLEGWSGPWRDYGHEVYRVAIDAQFPAEHRDIMTFEPSKLPWKPDIILASPPCTWFTVMQIGRNWTKDHQPKTEGAKLGLKLVYKTMDIINELKPKWFIIENPRAKLRVLEPLKHLERRTITYCQYGEKRMKPTDLWGVFPTTLKLNPPCKNGDSCHVKAPRGLTNATQGMDKHESAKIPRELSLAVLRACNGLS